MSNYQVVCYGEILWDLLPGGAAPGGAPMNVAYHLKKLGCKPALITKVGLDDWGKRLIGLMEENGICTDFFQLDYEHGTGRVNATIGANNEVSYEILKPVAWDNIQWEDGFGELVSGAKYFVYGSLATRSSASRNTLMQLLEAANEKVLDINLRAPFFNRTIVEDLIGKADILKLNLAELELITGWFASYSSIEDRVRAITDRFHTKTVVVTLGSEGALLFNGNSFRHEGFKIRVADTVGSGDAFLAGLLSKFLDNASAGEALDFASAMGAFIASRTGACPEYSMEDVYELIRQNSNQKAI